MLTYRECEGFKVLVDATDSGQHTRLRIDVEGMTLNALVAPDRVLRALAPEYGERVNDPWIEASYNRTYLRVDIRK